MNDELERKLQEVESAISFYRRNLISTQSFLFILAELYSLLSDSKVEKKLSDSPKRGEKKEEK